jgi:hypothetical protein
MIKLLFAIFIIASSMPNQISPGGPLDSNTYILSKENNLIFPAEAQFLYYAGQTGKQLHFQIYGDGTILISDTSIQEGGNKVDSLDCYIVIEEEDTIESIMDEIIDLDYLSYECNDVYDVSKAYYTTIRVGNDYYYNLHFMGEDENEPEWYCIIEYLEGLIDDYSIEENRIEPEDYLDAKTNQEELYGYNRQFYNYYINLYIEQKQLN